MHGVCRGPWPTAETCAAIVIERLLQLLWSIHHKGTHLEHWGTDGPALEQEELCRLASVANADRSV